MAELVVDQEQVDRENIRDEVVPVLGLLETTEGHLGAGNKLLGVLEVLELKKTSATRVFQLKTGNN